MENAFNLVTVLDLNSSFYFFFKFLFLSMLNFCLSKILCSDFYNSFKFTICMSSNLFIFSNLQSVFFVHFN